MRRSLGIGEDQELHLGYLYTEIPMRDLMKGVIYLVMWLNIRIWKSSDRIGMKIQIWEHHQ